MEVDQVRREARKYFDGVDSSHDWHHVKRVEILAERIAEEEDADWKVVKLAVLLHDIGRGKEDRGEIEDHARWGAREATDILGSNGYSEEVVEEVMHCILAHRYSGDVEPETVEAEVLSDADNLDALGATGVARTFCYSGEHGRALADIERMHGEDLGRETGLKHLTNKILSLKERMYTGTGKEMAEERHRFVEDFVAQMKEEVKGER
ncbi:MAG: HD domain-containing protein [Candidatus Nanohaloarchaea archaeon]